MTMIPPMDGIQNDGNANKVETTRLNSIERDGAISSSKSKKMETIRTQVKSGSYQVNFEKLAAAVLRSGELEH
jgi:anti-sigma28 factor (negative regulator of flagellin synthesis)